MSPAISGGWIVSHEAKVFTEEIVSCKAGFND